MKNVEHYQSAIIEELKEIGIKVPKLKKHVTKQDKGHHVNSECGVLFGHPIENLSRVAVDADGLQIEVPKFLVDALDVLRRNLDSEGLFRKAGSICRQKELRRNLDLGRSLSADSDPQDVASLVKLFLRLLPEPLLVKRLHDVFVGVQETDESTAKSEALRLVCLLLPNDHLAVLRYLMLFMAELAGHSRENKMTAYNLAVVLTPNIVVAEDEQIQRRKQGGGRLLRKQTGLVQYLITNASNIGHVPAKLLDRIRCQESALMSEDDLDGSYIRPISSRKKVAKKRHSINGVLHGLRRIVQPIRLSSECAGSTPPSTPLSATKRKHDDDHSQCSSSKKRAVMLATCADVPHPFPQPHFDSPDPVANENAVSLMPSSDPMMSASNKRKSGRMRFFGKSYLRRRTNSSRTPKTDGKPPPARGAVSCVHDSVRPIVAAKLVEASPSVPVFSLDASPATYLTRARREAQNAVASIVATASLVSCDWMGSSAKIPKSVNLSTDSDVDCDLAVKLDNNLKLKSELASCCRAEVRKVGSVRRPRGKKDDVDLESVTPPKSNFSRSLNRSALRRGRPNTVRSGLPAPSPFKAQPPDPDSMDPCNNSDPGPVFSPRTPPSASRTNMTRNLSCTPLRDWSTVQTDSPCPALVDWDAELKKRRPVRKSLNSALDPEQLEESNVANEPKMQEPECGSFELDDVFISADRSVEMSPVKPVAETPTDVFESGSLDSPVPSKTESLGNVLTKWMRDHAEPSLAGEPYLEECGGSDSSWICAANALDEALLRESDANPVVGRPSLVRLKKEKAGMVMASIKKYNEIASNTSLTIEMNGSKGSFRVASPVCIPPVFASRRSLSREAEKWKSPSSATNCGKKVGEKRNNSTGEQQKARKNGSSRITARQSKGRSRLGSSSHSPARYRPSPRSSAQRAVRRSPRLPPDGSRAKAASDAHRRRVRVSIRRRSTVLRRYRYSSDSDESDLETEDEGGEEETSEEDESEEDDDEEEVDDEEATGRRLNPTQLQQLPKVEKKEFCKKWILEQMNVEYLISEAKEPFASPSAALNDDDDHTAGPSPKPIQAKESQTARKRKIDETVKGLVPAVPLANPTGGSSVKVIRVGPTNARVGKIEGTAPFIIKVPQTTAAGGGPGSPLTGEQVMKTKGDGADVVPFKKSRKGGASAKRTNAIDSKVSKKAPQSKSPAVPIKLPRNVVVRKTALDVAPLILRRSPRLRLQSKQN